MITTFVFYKKTNGKSHVLNSFQRFYVQKYGFEFSKKKITFLQTDLY